MRRAVLLLLAGAAVAGGACASRLSRMHLALDASMERVLRTESYLRTVSGISANPSRLTRGDGFVYMSDVAPQLRYLAWARDTVRYRALRAFIADKMILREPEGLQPAQRYRSDRPLNRATPYGYLWLGKAFRDGWELLGDTTSAILLAQVRWSDAPSTASYTALYRVMARCADAMDVVKTDPEAGRAALRYAKPLIGSKIVEQEQAAAGVSAVEGEADALSCLTRLGLALNDPDVTVKYLDHLLDHLAPLLTHSGRPDLGTTADILLTLQLVRDAGPKYYAPHYTDVTGGSKGN